MEYHDYFHILKEGFNKSRRNVILMHDNTAGSFAAGSFAAHLLLAVPKAICSTANGSSGYTKRVLSIFKKQLLMALAVAGHLTNTYLSPPIKYFRQRTL